MNRRVTSRAISSTSRAVRCRPVSQPVRASRRPALAIAAAVIVIAGAAAAWFGLRRGTPPGPPDSPLVAVRPFRNLSQDPAQSYFTEGVTDEIRGQLSKISALRVLSRSAAERFGNADGPSIARDFGVHSLVEGSVRSSATACAWPWSWSMPRLSRRAGRSSTNGRSRTSSRYRARSRSNRAAARRHVVACRTAARREAPDEEYGSL